MSEKQSEQKSTENFKDRRLCSDCVQEEFLRAEIERTGDEGACFYCDGEGKTFSIDQITGYIDFGISESFYYTEQPGEGRVLADVIGDSAGIGPDAAEDVRQVLVDRQQPREEDAWPNQSCFGPEAHYVRNRSLDSSDIEGDWLFDFERSLKSETRYFNPTAELTLRRVFEGIDGHETINDHPIIVEAGPGTEFAELFRARVFQAGEKLAEAMKRPDKHLGPPPSSRAPAGRMNAAGISVFYGATEPKVALAEVRPPVGSRVLVARFDIIRPLRLLDLGALEFIADEKGSSFDKSHVERLKRAEFLRGLGRRISRPVMPDDEPRDYLPTQAVADFLATVPSPPLDGIIYSSVQGGDMARRKVLGRNRGGRNVVLFHKAASVREFDLPEGTRIEVFDDSLCGDLFGGNTPNFDDPNAKYHVVKEAPDFDSVSSEPDGASLKFSSFDIHYISAVDFRTVSSPVPRYRENRRENQPNGLDIGEEG